MSSSDSESDNAVPGPSRKKAKCVEAWKSVQRKKKRDSGESYTSTSGVAMPARKVGAACACPEKCFDLVGRENIDLIFNDYWAMGSHDRQSEYLANHVTSQDVKRSKVKDRPSRTLRRLCYTVKKGNKELEVCRTAFISIHGVSEKRVRNAMDKMGPSGMVEKDKRGKHVPGVKIPANKEKLAREHILSLRTVSSHYTRAKSPNRRYLPPGLNRKIMYDMYKDWLVKENKGIENLVKEWKYVQLVNEYNIGFEPPQSDSCNFCDEIDLKVQALHTENDVDEIQRLKIAKTVHTRKASAAQKLLKQFGQEADKPHQAVICMDLQQTMQSDCSSNKMENRDGKGELKVKDEPEEECAIALGKGREMEFLELGNKAMEDSHHSLQGWLNSSDQDEFEVKDEPVEEDYVCAFDSNGIKINEEEISSSPQNTSAFLIQLQHSIREGNYTPDQVFVLSKTGLFWKRLPGQTFISKKEEFSSGFKARNDRFSLLLCANASGDSRLKPFLVYYTSKLKDLKVTSFQMLPVHWRYNRRASLTTIMFEDWFANCAIPEILAYCKQKNIEEKALILVDSVIGQSDMINEIHPYVKVIFMPSDISPSIQPPDQFAITQFLQLYTKTLLQNMLIFTEGGDESHVEDFLKSYSIKEALFTIRDSWTAIKIPFLNKFWSYVWPGKTQNFTVHPNASGEIQEIRDLANRIPGQGFTDLTEDDIHRHLKSLQEELSTEESAQMTKATEGDDDNQQDTPTCSMPPTSELESIVKLLYKTERKIIETEWNPKRLEQSLPHLSSIKAMYMDILKTRKKR
ncbi:tigger transposable element-derived protein 1-like isoform X2 [Penaeus chinensis]|uniref:tigger transposable element-derived protein 1-like isoform X2 n=1 Tax=Penaeus chinensis TaxID=139456 RepID=UPI001FB752C4|nr:tigger transposable element-derived protein 1-like isoform X2 [Penaeus chinensis]